MVIGKKFTGLNRREFLKVGVLGTTSAFLGTNTLAKAVEYCSAEEPFAFPEPVYRTLGRTGMKITVVSFGAMWTLRENTWEERTRKLSPRH